MRHNLQSNHDNGSFWCREKFNLFQHAVNVSNYHFVDYDINTLL